MMMFVGNLSYVLVSIVGGLLVVNGNIRIGDVQAFIQYSQQLSQPMSQAASIARPANLNVTPVVLIGRFPCSVRTRIASAGIVGRCSMG